MLSFDLVNKVLFPSPKATYSLNDFPEELIWIPRSLDPENAPPEDCVPCVLLTSPSARFFVLYLHSNAEDLGRCYSFCSTLRYQFQVNVLAVEYPGYGICPGAANEESVKKNAFLAFDFLRKVLEWPLDEIIIMGRSIGSGPAVAIASKHRVSGLILVCPFLSVRELVREFLGTVADMMVERFPNNELMKLVSSPLLLVHGKEDAVVPWSHGRTLYEICRARKRLVAPETMRHNSNLHSDASWFVLPMLQFFAVPDYKFDELQVPAWAYDKRHCPFYSDDIGGFTEGSTGCLPCQGSSPVQQECIVVGPGSRSLPARGSEDQRGFGPQPSKKRVNRPLDEARVVETPVTTKKLAASTQQLSPVVLPSPPVPSTTTPPGQEEPQQSLSAGKAAEASQDSPDEGPAGHLGAASSDQASAISTATPAASVATAAAGAAAASTQVGGGTAAEAGGASAEQVAQTVHVPVDEATSDEELERATEELLDNVLACNFVQVQAILDSQCLDIDSDDCSLQEALLCESIPLSSSQAEEELPKPPEDCGFFKVPRSKMVEPSAAAAPDSWSPSIHRSASSAARQVGASVGGGVYGAASPSAAGPSAAGAGGVWWLSPLRRGPQPLAALPVQRQDRVAPTDNSHSGTDCSKTRDTSPVIKI